MATFQVGIGKDDIQQGQLMPEDWYTMEIVREPYEDKNNAWKEAGAALPIEEAGRINPKAGKNIVINLRVVSDVPEFSGRPFTKWLSLPSPLDEGQYMNNGQPKPDWKAEIIYKWADAFGGAIEGASASLTKGQKALVYVVQGKDRDGETDVNEISMNVNPRSLTAGSGPLGGGDPFDGKLL
jgi:hypothetical protein